ncbi:MAG: polymer-forming cytoskeletal protein [Bdellovibrionales bacterium]|jgi:cytoskeletal protein CcmA (bactofilin family)
MNELNVYSGNEEQKEFIPGQVTALLDQGCSFDGRLTFEGTVRIGGTFRGEIFTNDTLVVNPGAKIDAQIEAETVIICGAVKGNIFARRKVIMHPPATFTGTVTTPSLRIDEGVVFEGASYMPKN